jgi:ATP-dependent RNA helicase DOB1
MFQNQNILGHMQGLGEVGRRFPDGVPLLDPEEDLGLKDDVFRKTQR